MLVKHYMTRHPLMAEPTMSIVAAQRFMGENKIRHLPVAGDGKRLLGLVTRQSLMVDPGKLGSLDLWEIAGYLSRLTLSEVMVKAADVVTVDPEMTLEGAARIMVERKIGCLPVIEAGVLIGIITEMDLLAQLMEIMATRVPGVRVTLRMPDVKGEIARLVKAVSDQGWGILALGGAPVPKDPSKWEAVLKIRHVTSAEVAAVVGSISGHEIIDLREV